MTTTTTKLALFKQGQGVNEAANGLPNGGSAGQVLTKVDAADYHATWQTPSAGPQEAIAAHVAQADPHPQYLSKAEGDSFYENKGVAAQLLSAHNGATDPHPQYLTQAEADALYTSSSAPSGVSSVNSKTGAVTLTAADIGADAAGAASAAVSAHNSATDPHPQYMTSAEGNAAYETAGAVAAHAGATDPHPQYLTQAESDARYLQPASAQPYDIVFFYPGIPPANTVLLDVEFARTVTFPANFAGSALKSAVAATNNVGIKVFKDSTEVGMMTFAAAASTTTMTTSGVALTFNAGNRLRLIIPSTVDATLADLRGVLAGTR